MMHTTILLNGDNLALAGWGRIQGIDLPAQYSADYKKHDKQAI